MKKMKEERIDSLAKEIEFVQKENSRIDFDESIKKINKLNIKDTLYFMLGIIGIIGGLIFKSIYVFLGSIFLEVLILLIIIFKNSLKEIKLIKGQFNEKIKNSHEKFFKETYENDYILNDEIIKNNEILNKEEVIIRIKQLVEIYSKIYSLPAITISNGEWNAIVKELYNLFEQKELQNEFYESVVCVLKITLAKSLVNQTKNIEINDFASNINYLVLDYHDINGKTKKITKAETDSIKKKMMI